MKLPAAERAVVDPTKVRDYLLSPEHPVGRHKARFFSALGFERAAWPALHRMLLEVAREGDASEGSATPYGRKYEVRATIHGPTGRTAEIVTVWIILVGEDFPRLVTAYPGGSR
jgi:hypothetical protein